MTNHSSELDPAMAALMQETGDLRKAHLQQSIGATGQFPEGKLTKQDEGGIQFGVTNTMGKVVVNFGKPVAWLGMRPTDARELARILLIHADRAEIIGASRAEDALTAKNPETVS